MLSEDDKRVQPKPSTVSDPVGPWISSRNYLLVRDSLDCPRKEWDISSGTVLRQGLDGVSARGSGTLKRVPDKPQQRFYQCPGLQLQSAPAASQVHPSWAVDPGSKIWGTGPPAAAISSWHATNAYDLINRVPTPATCSPLLLLSLHEEWERPPMSGLFS